MGIFCITMHLIIFLTSLENKIILYLRELSQLVNAWERYLVDVCHLDDATSLKQYIQLTPNFLTLSVRRASAVQKSAARYSVRAR
jgi:hypothetical protein